VFKVLLIIPLAGEIIIFNSKIFFLLVLNRASEIFESVCHSEEDFTPGQTLLIMLPIAGEGSSSNEARYLIQDIYLTSRWPVLVLNFSNEMTKSMYTEIHQHFSYVVLISGPCKYWEPNSFNIRKQLSALSGDNMRESWKPNARFIIQVMSNCT